MTKDEAIRQRWEPKRRLRETLDEMTASLKNDPQTWYQENGLPPPDLD